MRSLGAPADLGGARSRAAIATAGVARTPRERGRYLVNAMQCPLCHTPISAETGAYDTRYFLAGGMRVSAYPWGVWYSRNLTPDVATGLGRWSEDEIVAAVTRGVRRDGGGSTRWRCRGRGSRGSAAADARAIAAYLKALPPVLNAVPPPEHRLDRRTRRRQAAGARSARRPRVEFWGGNAARTHDLPDVATPARRRAAWALGWGTLILALGAGAFALRDIPASGGAAASSCRAPSRRSRAGARSGPGHRSPS